MQSSRRIALACAAAAVAVCGAAAAAVLSVNDGEVSALVRVSEADAIAPLAREADPDFVLVHPQAHYDGVYFYAIARDPFARGEAHELIDRSAYRYGHPGYGWLAGLLSFGSAAAVPGALLFVSLVCVAVAAFTISLLAAELGWSRWSGLIVAFSPGILFAITADTSEPTAIAAASLALLAWTRRRWTLAGLALIAACLIKEPLLLIPAALGLWEIVAWLRGRASPELYERLVAVAVGPLVFGGWYAYLRGTFGTWPFRAEAADFFTAPFIGWWDSIRRSAMLATGAYDQSQLGSAAVAILAVVFAALVAGTIKAVRFRSWIDVLFLLYAVMLFCMNWLALQYPKDLLREAVVPLLLLPAVLAGPPPAEGRPPPSG